MRLSSACPAKRRRLVMGESDVVADSDLEGSRGIMVLFVKQVHLQKEVGAD